MPTEQEQAPLPLHLHTLDSLLREIISGRPVLLGKDDETFAIDDEATRAILGWFFEDRDRWSGNANDQDAWEIVEASKSTPTEYPALALTDDRTATPTYRVKSVCAHHFGGLQEYGEEGNVEYALASGTTLFEGKNGSGKTALLNAPIWCLTGKILRSQQLPQPGDGVVEARAGKSENEVLAKSVAVSPTPPDTIVKQHEDKFVPIDTWVEVVLIGPDGKDLPPLKRRIYTDDNGRLKTDDPDTSSIILPPTAFETSTTMPGMLPLIRLGENNDVGKAISELTGFNELRDLADRARRLQGRMSGQMTEYLKGEIADLQATFTNIWEGLIQRLQENPALKPLPPEDYPFLEKGPTTENDLTKLKDHFDGLESQAFEQAKDILGMSFEPADEELRIELRQNVGQALGLIDFSAISRLDSARRLDQLKSLTDDELENAQELIATLFKEYEELSELAKNPDIAARERLYARVAEWIHEVEDIEQHLKNCALCSGKLDGMTDPVTGLSVQEHLAKRIDEPSEILSQTLEAWRDHAESRLSHKLPEALRSETGQDLPATPSDLMTSALTDELFAQGSFQGSLASLKTKVEKLSEETFGKLSSFEEPAPLAFPTDFESNFSDLAIKLTRVNRALSFTHWRKDNSDAWDDAILSIIGPTKAEESTKVPSSLFDMLSALDAIITNTEPIRLYLKDVNDLRSTLKSITEREAKTQELSVAAKKVSPLLELGDLVDRQMDMLQVELHDETTIWKDRVYFRPAGTAPRHAETHVSPEGSLNFSSETRGTRVPSQHVSNASDMRATLFAFLIAFWKHVRSTHGGLDLMVFDDPQELFDRENLRRLSKALRALVEEDAQLLISSYEPRFTDKLSSELRQIDGVEFYHRRISPITKSRPVVGHDLMERDLEIEFKAFLSPEAGKEDKAAKDYVTELRRYIENRLSECFPERIHGLSQDDTIGPYVNHIRRLANSNRPPYATPPFQNLVDDPAYADRSDVLEILNRSHHKDADTITRNEVNTLKDDLARAKSLIDDAYMHFELDRMGETSDLIGKRPKLEVQAPKPIKLPEIVAPVYLDLAASTSFAVEIESQTDEAPLTGELLDGSALYCLNTHNFGFAAWRGCFVIVDAESAPVENDRLVVARYGETNIAGRLLRDPNRPGMVAIASEAENPLSRPEPSFVFEDAVALHKVTGVLFNDDPPPDLRRRSIGDVAPIDNWPPLDNINVAFKVTDDSAIPLALPGQILLGGRALSATDFKGSEEKLVAVATSDGRQIFKKIGKPVFSSREDILQFESIGGKGNSVALALEEDASDGEIPFVVSARIIIGVLYKS